MSVSIDNLVANGSLSARLVSTQAGVQGVYTVGVTGQAIVIPTDANMIGARDISMAAGATNTLHLDDFHLNAESDPFDTPDCTPISFVTMYAIFIFILSEAIVASSGNTINITATGPGFSGTLRAIEATAGAYTYDADAIGIAISGASDLVLVETVSQAASVVQVIAIGKDS